MSVMVIFLDISCRVVVSSFWIEVAILCKIHYYKYLLICSIFLVSSTGFSSSKVWKLPKIFHLSVKDKDGEMERKIQKRIAKESKQMTPAYYQLITLLKRGYIKLKRDTVSQRPLDFNKRENHLARITKTSRFSDHHAYANNCEFLSQHNVGLDLRQFRRRCQ